LGTYAGSNSSEATTFDSPMKLKSATPEVLIAEGVETKCFASLCERFLGIGEDRSIK
jgi:hypothetical protein